MKNLSMRLSIYYESRKIKLFRWLIRKAVKYRQKTAQKKIRLLSTSTFSETQVQVRYSSSNTTLL
jgi:hypothetical protein